MAVFRGDNGNNRIRGTGDNDKIFGEGGKDKIDGRNGNDRIEGGKGDDELEGGGGRDQFIFRKGSGRDVVLDFKNNEDTFYIDKDFGFDSVKQVLKHASSSGGDSAIDLSKNGDDSPRIIILGLDDYNKLSDDIILI